MNIIEFKEKCNNLCKQFALDGKYYADESILWQARATQAIKPFIDKEKEELIPQYGVSYTANLIERIAELISAIISKNKWNILSAISDVRLSMIAQAYIHDINIVDYVTLPDKTKIKMILLNAIRLSTNTGLLSIIEVLSACQKVFAESIEKECDKIDILIAYFMLDKCCEMIEAEFNFGNNTDYMMLAANIIKLNEIVGVV